MGHKKKKDKERGRDDDSSKLRESLSPCANVISPETRGRFYQVIVAGTPMIVPEEFISCHPDGNKSVMLGGIRHLVNSPVEVALEKGPARSDSDDPSIVSLDVPSTVSSTTDFSIDDDKFYQVRAKDEHYKVLGCELIDSTDGSDLYFIEVGGELLAISDIEEDDEESVFEDIQHEKQLEGASHLVDIQPFTDPAGLQQLPQLGGEVFARTDSSSSESESDSSSQTVFSGSEHPLPLHLIPASKAKPSPKTLGSKVVLKQPIVPEMHLYKPSAAKPVQPNLSPKPSHYPAPLLSQSSAFTKTDLKWKGSTSSIFSQLPISENSSQPEVEDKVSADYPLPKIPTNAGEFTVLTVQHESCIPYKSQQNPIEQYPSQFNQNIGQSQEYGMQHASSQQNLMHSASNQQSQMQRASSQQNLMQQTSSQQSLMRQNFNQRYGSQQNLMQPSLNQQDQLQRASSQQNLLHQASSQQNLMLPSFNQQDQFQQQYGMQQAYDNQMQRAFSQQNLMQNQQFEMQRAYSQQNLMQQAYYRQNPVQQAESQHQVPAQDDEGGHLPNMQYNGIQQNLNQNYNGAPQIFDQRFSGQQSFTQHEMQLPLNQLNTAAMTPQNIPQQRSMDQCTVQQVPMEQAQRGVCVEHVNQTHITLIDTDEEIDEDESCYDDESVFESIQQEDMLDPHVPYIVTIEGQDHVLAAHQFHATGIQGKYIVRHEGTSHLVDVPLPCAPPIPISPVQEKIPVQKVKSLQGYSPKSILKNKKIENQSRLKNGRSATQLQSAENAFVYPIPSNTIVTKKVTKAGFFSPLNYIQKKVPTTYTSVCQEFLSISELQHKIVEESAVKVKTRSKTPSDVSDDSEDSVLVPDLPGLECLFEKVTLVQEHNQRVPEQRFRTPSPAFRTPSPGQVIDLQLEEKMKNMCGLSDLLEVVARVNERARSPSVQPSPGLEEAASADEENPLSLMLDQLPRLSDFGSDALAHAANCESSCHMTEVIHMSDQSDTNSDDNGVLAALPGLEMLAAVVEDIDRRTLLEEESPASPHRQGNVPELLGLDAMALKVIRTRSSSSSSSTLNTLRQIDDITSLNSSIRGNYMGQGCEAVSSVSPLSDGVSYAKEDVFKVLVGGVWYTAKESDLRWSGDTVYFVMIDKTHELVDQCIKMPGVNSPVCDEKMYNVTYAGKTYPIMGRDIVPTRSEMYFNVIINGATVQVEPDDIAERKVRKVKREEGAISVKIGGKWKNVPAHKFVPSGSEIGQYYLKKGSQSVFFNPAELYPFLTAVDMPLGTNVVPQSYKVRIDNKDITLPLRAFKLHSTKRQSVQVEYNNKTHTVKLSTVYPSEDKTLPSESLQPATNGGVKGLQPAANTGLSGLQSLSTTTTGTFSAAEYKNNLYYLQIEGKNVNIPGRHIKPHKARLGYCKMRYRGKIFRIKSDKIKLSRQCVSKPVSIDNGSPCSMRSQHLYNEGIGFTDTRPQSPSQMDQVSISSNVSKASVRYPHFSELLRAVPNIVPDKHALLAASTNKSRSTTKISTKISTKTSSTVLVQQKNVHTSRNASRNTSRNTLNKIETIPELPLKARKTKHTTKVRCGQEVNLKVKTSPMSKASSTKPPNIHLDVKTPPQLKVDPLSLPNNISISPVHQELDLVLPARKKKKTKFTISLSAKKQDTSLSSHAQADARSSNNTQGQERLSGDTLGVVHQERDFVLSNLRRSPALVCPVSPIQRPLTDNTLFINCDDLIHIPLKIQASQDKHSKTDTQLQQQISSKAGNDVTTKSEFQQLGGIGSPPHVASEQGVKILSLTKESIATVGTKGPSLGAYIQRVTSGNQEIQLLSVAQQAIT